MVWVVSKKIYILKTICYPCSYYKDGNKLCWFTKFNRLKQVTKRNDVLNETSNDIWHMKYVLTQNDQRYLNMKCIFCIYCPLIRIRIWPFFTIDLKYGWVWFGCGKLNCVISLREIVGLNQQLIKWLIVLFNQICCFIEY